MNITEMIVVVQCYIHLRKGVEVNINPNSLNNPLQYAKLAEAYNIAIEYFRQNNTVINKI